MAIYYVNQGKTYTSERDGGYIWSPKLNKIGGQNKGYNLMPRVKQGDYLLHNSKGKISAISVVKEDCKSGEQPSELKIGQSEGLWNDNGWIIYTTYYEVTNPISTSNLVDWMIKNYREDSAFQKNGKSKLQYLCTLEDSHARYLIEAILANESNKVVADVLLAALNTINNNSVINIDSKVTKGQALEALKEDRPVRIKWDKFETALLIDAFWRVENNPNTRKDEISKLSVALRQKAVKAGMVIDETYRNYDGINMQLYSIAPLLKPGKPVRNHSMVFEEMAALYKTNKESYKEILKIAKQMTDGFNNIDGIEKAENNSSPEDFEDRNYLSDDLFVLLRDESTNNQYGTTATYLAQKLRVPEINVKNILSISPWAKYQFGTYKFALDDKNEKKYEKVRFDDTQSLTFTKPISITYFEEEIFSGDSWRKAYLDCCVTLYDDYPAVFEKLGDDCEDGKNEIVYTQEKLPSLRVVGRITGTLFVELDLPPRNIVDNIKTILNLCNVDYENLVIKYIRKDKETKRRVEACTTETEYHEELESTSKQEVKDVASIEKRDTEDNKEELKLDKSREEVKDKLARYPKQSQNSFYWWLLEEKEYTRVDASKSIATINQIEQFAKINISNTCRLFSNNRELVEFTLQSLLRSKAFHNKNEKLKNRYMERLNLLSEYVGYNDGNHILTYYDKQERLKRNESELQTTDTVFQFQEQVISVLTKKYAFGFRAESTIELSRFRRFAQEEKIELPEDDEVLKSEIIHAGILYDGKIYVVDKGVLDKLSKNIDEAASKKTRIVFFESFMEVNAEFMEESHIFSAEMLKTIIERNHSTLLSNYQDVYVAKSFISLSGKENAISAVSKEIKRVWGKNTVKSVNEINDELEYIPRDAIVKSLSRDDDFIWASEESYFLIDRLKLTAVEEETVYQFVAQQCETKGFSALVDIPLETIEIENYEIPRNALRSAIFRKVLSKDFYLNRTIITREKEAINIDAILHNYIEGRSSCSFSEVNNLVEEIMGGTHRYIAYEALYSAMIRVDEDNYIEDQKVHFDVDVIDEILSSFIPDRFIAIKEITTFSLFPVCGYTWNHYLLESYCHKYSKRFNLQVISYNDKNAGIIVEKDVQANYDDLLAEAAARENIKLEPENVGNYFFNAGYMAKSRFSRLDQVVEKAKKIRGEV